MHKLALTVFIGISMIFATGLSTASLLERSESYFERAVHCQWLTASNDDTQGNQSDSPPEEEEEPDCE